MTNSSQQLAFAAVMVKPSAFGFNPQTAKTNVFQKDLTANGKTAEEIRDKALNEFHGMVSLLTQHHIDVYVLASRQDVVTPDAVFPNNWFSHHADGILIFYPMLSENRRAERQIEILSDVFKTARIPMARVIDFSPKEEVNQFLEGTGSLVLDRTNRVAFAMESPRTTQVLFNEWCEKMKYRGVFFHAYDEKSLPIYHTNVVMSVGEKFVVACLEAIQDSKERRWLEKQLTANGHQLIPISLKQVYAFCGNILQMQSKEGPSKIIMSQTAFEGFTKKQREILATFGELIPIAIPTIETVGGGSVRCMIAEVFQKLSG